LLCLAMTINKFQATANCKILLVNLWGWVKYHARTYATSACCGTKP